MRKLALALSCAVLATAAPSAHAGPVHWLFQHIAAAKGARVFHADGTAFHATVTDAQGATHDAVVRVSRGGADTKTHPDLLGLAIKMKDPLNNGGPDQDMLFITSFEKSGVGGRVPEFARGFSGHAMSSITSFQMGDKKGPLTAQLPASFATPVDDSPARPTGDRSFSVMMQSKRFLRAAEPTTVLQDVTVHFDRPLSAADSTALRFSPFHDGAGIKPLGWINARRKQAMAGSQAGRGDPGN